MLRKVVLSIVFLTLLPNFWNEFLEFPSHCWHGSYRTCLPFWHSLIWPNYNVKTSRVESTIVTKYMIRTPWKFLLSWLVKFILTSLVVCYINKIHLNHVITNYQKYTQTTKVINSCLSFRFSGWLKFCTFDPH